jgi:site-specific recombinase XerD
MMEQGASTFEIKQLLNYDSIQTAERYLQIHVKLMRKVLFDETL